MLTAAALAAPLPAQATASASGPAIILKGGTAIHLMILREVSTRSAHSGDPFPMQVNEPVVVDGITVIPIGAKAWGEVESAEASGLAGRSGKLSARLLYIEGPGGRIALDGAPKSVGTPGAMTTMVATATFAALGAGPLGLLARGTNAKLKAGEIVVGTVAADTPLPAAR